MGRSRVDPEQDQPPGSTRLRVDYGNPRQGTAMVGLSYHCCGPSAASSSGRPDDRFMECAVRASDTCAAGVYRAVLQASCIALALVEHSSAARSSSASKRHGSRARADQSAGGLKAPARPGGGGRRVGAGPTSEPPLDARAGCRWSKPDRRLPWIQRHGAMSRARNTSVQEMELEKIQRYQRRR